MLPVPASNLFGGPWYSERSMVTSAIMLPPPCHGGVSANASSVPYSTPMPVGPKILWPENTKKSAPVSETSIGMCGIDCAPSIRTRAP